MLCGPLWRGAAGDAFLIDNPFALDPGLGWRDEQSLDDTVAAARQACAQHQLEFWLDISVTHAASDGALAREHPEWYQVPDSGLAALDPRLSEYDRACCRVRREHIAEDFLRFWEERLTAWSELGVSGFRVVYPHHLDSQDWRVLIDSVHDKNPNCTFTAWTPGIPATRYAELGEAGFVAGFGSLPWWDFRDTWFVREYRNLRCLGNIYMPAVAPDDPSLCDPGDVMTQQRLWCAAHAGDGLLAMLPKRDSYHAGELERQLAEANAWFARQYAGAGHLRQLTGDAAPFTALERQRSRRATLLLLNPSPIAPTPIDWLLVRTRLTGFVVDDNSVEIQQPINHLDLPPLTHAPADTASSGPSLSTASAAKADGKKTATKRTIAPVLPDHLPAAGSALATLTRPEPVVTLKRKRARSTQNAALVAALQAPRIVIQDLQPSTAEAAHLIKRIAGEPLTVRANVFMDGHDVLRVFLLWRAVDEIGWHPVEMTPLGNDAWEATCVPERIGRHEYTIRAWRDAYGSFQSALAKKVEAGLDVDLEVREGQELLARCGVTDAESYDAERLLAPETLMAAHRAELHEFETQLEPPQSLIVERREAIFANWYEMFPRSQSDRPGKHGTFRDVIARLPYVRDMGFNVLYFPPIHPIGNKNRKGRNNALVAARDDPGSPYAIGSAAGGHDAIHPELGTLDDFRALVAAAREYDLEIALDFAIQCSPDHPWLESHPEWFAWRADGSLHYAENPPKKYEDIVNVEFYGAEDAARPPDKRAHTMALWYALRDVVLFWVDQGVQTFRVDNPHTKPLPFWQWLIREVQGLHPHTVFLSEAFTRPNMMYRLAKIGFSQSYTYFTWRNTKHELTEYLEEIANAPVAEYFRPHFFVNTPDINPRFLQTSGRPGFLIRAALATTMSGLWGMYNGFELCEATPLPGREEYLDSEKYEIKVWDWDRPGHIRAEIAHLNRLRLENPALHSHRGIRFHPAANEHVLFYSKATRERDNVLLIAVSLDPFHPQSAAIELPLWMLGLPPDDGVLYCEDLLHGHRFTWHGKHHTIHLTPDEPYAIWRVRAQS